MIIRFLTSLIKESVMFSTKDDNSKPLSAETLMKRTSDTRTHVILTKLSMLKVKSKKKNTTLLSSKQNMQKVQSNKSEKSILSNISSLLNHYDSDLSLSTLNKHVHITKKI